MSICAGPALSIAGNAAERSHEKLAKIGTTAPSAPVSATASPHDAACSAPAMCPAPRASRPSARGRELLAFDQKRLADAGVDTEGSAPAAARARTYAGRRRCPGCPDTSLEPAVFPGTQVLTETDIENKKGYSFRRALEPFLTRTDRGQWSAGGFVPVCFFGGLAEWARQLACPAGREEIWLIGFQCHLRWCLLVKYRAWRRPIQLFSNLSCWA